MSTVSPQQINPGDGITAASVNTPINQLANVLNGNIDDTNVSSLSGSKLNNGTVTGAKLADGTITAAKTTGLGWEELGRTTLSATSTTIDVTLSTARKQLLIVAYLLNTASITVFLRFNGDTGTNYAWRSTSNGAADGTGASQQSIPTPVIGNYPGSFDARVTNFQSNEKMVYMQSVAQNTAGAANLPGRTELAAKWANTTAQITTVNVLTTTSTFASGSVVMVLGKD